jgi:ferredoxin--NADP+ reductase
MTTTDRPLRVAVVGGGPAGLYTADALTFDPDSNATVDILERLPVPFGLLRYGVAPDHLTMKLAVNSLQEVLDRPSVRLFCNVEIGRDIAVEELRRHYDAVVYATGADADNRLAIPGEDLTGSSSATSFVKWYNGHPEAMDFDLSRASTVGVIGAGNVALDVTRILVKQAEELRNTDIDEATLVALAASTVTDVHIFIRRGAEFAKFTTKELRELGELHDVDIVVDPEHVPADDAGELGAVAKRNIALLRAWSGRTPTGATRRIHFHFSTRPTEILGEQSVRAIRVERSGTDDCRDIPVDMILRAVGYRSRPIVGVPFSDETATIPHEDHRVIRDGAPQRGEYAVGWAKRGPSGVLGTNRSDAEATAGSVFDDRVELLMQRTEDFGGALNLLTTRGTRFLDNEAWNTIADREIQLGTIHGRQRIKIRSWDELVAAGSPAFTPS